MTASEGREHLRMGGSGRCYDACAACTAEGREATGDLNVHRPRWGHMQQREVCNCCGKAWPCPAVSWDETHQHTTEQIRAAAGRRRQHQQEAT